MRYRDANCDFDADPNGGTIATVKSNNCYMEATAERATELENLREEY
ncbi:lysozyme inhibitor LprI family protein [Acinetobacter schindleri]